MKRFLSLLAVLLTALSPLFAELPTVVPSSIPNVVPTPTPSKTLEEQRQIIADQLAPLYKKQFYLLRSNSMPYQVYEESDSGHKLSLRGTWEQDDGLFDERKNEKFSDPANLLDALGQEYALHLDLIKRSHGIADESSNIDTIASSSLSASDCALFDNFKKRLPQATDGNPYNMESHDTTTMISNEYLYQHPLSNTVAMEASFLKLEFLSLLLDMESSQGATADCSDFIKQLDQLPVDNYDDLVAAQHKMVDLEKELRAPLSASQETIRSMETQERGVEPEVQRAEPSHVISKTLLGVPFSNDSYDRHMNERGDGLAWINDSYDRHMNERGDGLAWIGLGTVTGTPAVGIYCAISGGFGDGLILCGAAILSPILIPLGGMLAVGAVGATAYGLYEVAHSFYSW